MHQIFEIAKRELKSLFYSPIGWLTLVIFMIHSAMVLMGRIDAYMSFYESRGVDHYPYTFNVFIHPSVGLLRVMASFYYLYIPLLTMGLLSKEYQDGSIKLLFSSPVRTHQITLGKYLAILCYSLLLMAIYVLLYLTVSYFVLETVDHNLILSGIIFSYLIIALYLAIGLFISSLTIYPLAAAVGTLAVLFILNSYLATLIQDHHPVLLQLLVSEWLPPFKHLEQISGLWHSGALIYFGLMILLFLLLTYWRLRFLRESRTFMNKMLIVATLTVATLAAGVITFNPDRFIYFDMTDKKRFSPSQEQEIWLAEFDKTPTMKKYTPIFEVPFEGGIRGMSGSIFTTDRIRKSIKVKPYISHIPFAAPTNQVNLAFFQEIQVYSDARVLATEIPENLNRSTDQMNLDELVEMAIYKYSWIDPNKILSESRIAEIFDTTETRYHARYFIHAGEQEDVLHIGAGFPTDQEYTANLKSMILGKSKLGFLSENGEKSPFDEEKSGLSRMFQNRFGQYSLLNQGFSSLVLNGKGGDSLEQFIENISNVTQVADVMVIADPTINYSDSTHQTISNWINQGGNMLIMTSAENYAVLQQLVYELGLRFTGDQPVESYAKINPNSVISEHWDEGIFINQVARSRTVNATLLNEDNSGAIIAMSHSTTIESIAGDDAGFDTISVLKAGQDILMVALTREYDHRQQRIIVSAGTDFISNNSEGIGFRSAFNDGMHNSSLVLSLFRWLSNDEYPVLVERDSHLEKLIYRDTTYMKLGLLWGIPMLLFMMGSLVVVSRRRK